MDVIGISLRVFSWNYWLLKFTFSLLPISFLFLNCSFLVYLVFLLIFSVWFIIILFKSLFVAQSFKFQRREIMSCLRKNILLEVIKIPLFIFKCVTEQITHFNNFLFRFVCFYPYLWNILIQASVIYWVGSVLYRLQLRAILFKDWWIYEVFFLGSVFSL